jgi:hypothetical protein
VWPPSAAAAPVQIGHSRKATRAFLYLYSCHPRPANGSVPGRRLAYHRLHEGEVQVTPFFFPGSTGHRSPTVPAVTRNSLAPIARRFVDPACEGDRGGPLALPMDLPTWLSAGELRFDTPGVTEFNPSTVGTCCLTGEFDRARIGAEGPIRPGEWQPAGRAGHFVSRGGGAGSKAQRDGGRRCHPLPAVQPDGGLSAVPLPGADTTIGRTARRTDRSSFGEGGDRS